MGQWLKMGEETLNNRTLDTNFGQKFDQDEYTRIPS